MSNDRFSAPPAATPVVTHVAIRKSAGFNLLSVDEFFMLPLSERMDLVLQRQVTFLDEHGRLIALRDGLRALRSLRTSRRPESA